MTLPRGFKADAERRAARLRAELGIADCASTCSPTTSAYGS
ncbi:hypothetical protein [Streptomyces sp. ID05-47C]|nr:hypothetical protein [Streptomyces sp. ID05-47C]MDX3570864.1 hypothetical protein [Streptomyces sp. ID05-47C]